jgi:transcriptional regulator with XRE-family HTH domain
MKTATTIKNFKDHLGMIREQKGISQQELSRYSGLDLSYIQEIEKGHTEPELVVLLTIADSLEIDVKHWFDY